MDHYHSDIALVLKVESEAAFQRIEELVEPDDVDGLMVGKVDLSVDMGIPGQTGHKRVLELSERARAACRERGIQFGEIVSSPDEIPEAIKRGAGWIIMGSEMGILADFWRRASQAARNS
jgi:2-keto-3-deoxy-L-rhamnonate aldolase RhmA